MKFGKNKTDRKRRRPETDDRPEQRRRAVYSYYASGSSKDSVPIERSSPTPARNWFRLAPTIVISFIIIGSLLYSLTLSASPHVSLAKGQEVSVYRELSDYARATEVLMERSIGNRTKFTVQTSTIEQQLMDEYPELSAVALRLPVLGRKPTLIIEIRQPKLILTTQTRTFVLDNDGVAVSEARLLQAADKQNLPVIIDQSGLEAEVGRQLLTRETVQFVLDAKAQLEAKDMTISQLVLPVSVNELDINIEGLSYFVKTDTSGDSRLQIGSFLAAAAHLNEQGITPSEYIDVRVEEKVFYK